MTSKHYYDSPATYSRYYDKPDGEDILTKTMVTSRYAAGVGLVFSTHDVLLYSHPQGLTNILKRYMFLTLPLVGMAATFTLVSNNLQLLRKRDDILNYAAGGAACGPIYGFWQKSKFAMFVVGLGLSIAAMAKKGGVDNGWVFFPEAPHMYNSATSLRRNWSMFQDVEPKGWTTVPDIPGDEEVIEEYVSPKRRKYPKSTLPYCDDIDDPSLANLVPGGIKKEPKKK